MNGHSKEQCYKLVGYPPHYKISKKIEEKTNEQQSGGNQQQGVKQQTIGNYQQTGHTIQQQFFTKSAEGNHMLTTEQYSQLLKLLGSVNVVAHKVNMVGNLVNSCSWTVDSSASAHITTDFTFPIKDGSRNQNIILPNNATLPVSSSSSIPLTENIEFVIVLQVPNSKFNILSVSQLTKNINCFTTFSPKDVVIQDLSSKRKIGEGREREELYIFEPNKKTCLLVSHISNSESWPHQLGYPSSARLMILENFLSCKVDDKFHCSICQLAKKSRIPFPISTSLSKEPFDLLLVDMWGPYKIESKNRAFYFLTIVYD